MLSVASAAWPQGSRVSSAVELARQVDQLKPGEWVWAPNISPSGPVTVYVDLSRQLATIYRNGVRIGVSTVSSGRPGYETPTGVFTILQKDAHHRSSIYHNAPMAFQERLTWGGVALHAGGLPGYPESHGCVHLPYAFAQDLFQITEMGGTVVISGAAGAPVRGVGAGVLAPIDVAGGSAVHLPLDGENYRWTPEVAPEGPITIIMSRSNQEVVVLRNGVEIGRARANIPTDDFATHVLTLTRDAQGTPHWVYVNVPGHQGEAGLPLDMTVAERAQMPKAFYDSVRAILQPGATILVTQAEVDDNTTGPQLTVLASQ
jgi:hypothetical protein